jgi:hypothetical protein
LGEGVTHNSGASRREIAESYLAVIAREAKQSIKQESKDGLLRRFAPRNDGLISELLRIASRSLSSGAHSRDPLARNDGNWVLSSLIHRTRRTTPLVDHPTDRLPIF